MNKMTFKRLANIHAVDVPLLLAGLVNAFVEEMGIERNDPVAAQLLSTPDSETLARINWKAISVSLQERAPLPIEKQRAFIQHVRLLADRTVIYTRLYYAISGRKLLER